MTQLEILQARKTKADAMGPEVIRSHQALYEEICDEIYRLQLSEDLEEELAAVILNAMQLPWPAGDALTDCEKHFHGAVSERDRLEQLLTVASNRGHPDAFRWYLPIYRRAWISLNELANERLELERTMDKNGFSPEYRPTPFECKSL